MIDPIRRLGQAARRAEILYDLRLTPHLRVTEMAARFAVTPETIRRDLAALESEGRIARAHGGASAPVAGARPDLEARGRARPVERARIGRLAAESVRPSETLMIDAGSTTFEMARHLAWTKTPCTVVTNALHVAMTLGRAEGVRVVICPGDYVPGEAATVGCDAVAFLERRNVNRCFIGASAISEDSVSEAVPGFAAIKRAMISRADRSHLLIDASKFGLMHLDHVADLGEFDSVITDQPCSAGLARRLQKLGVSIEAA